MNNQRYKVTVFYADGKEETFYAGDMVYYGMEDTHKEFDLGNGVARIVPYYNVFKIDIEDYGSEEEEE